MTYIVPELITAFPLKRGRLIMPLPQTDAELEILTLVYFGLRLHATFTIYEGGTGSYKVKELYNDYHGKGWLYNEQCVVGYEHSRMFWKAVFGVLICSGIAGHSYGQYKTRSHRNIQRLVRWKESQREDRGSALRPAFTRLARQLSERERTERKRASSSVLLTGRVDGAVIGSLS